MFISVVIPVLVISMIGASLATVLVIAELTVSNYGQCEIAINQDRRLTVQGGYNLLGVLQENKIFIPSACGGRGTCGLCKVRVPEGAGALLPTEEPYLDQQERDSEVRLSCQVKVRNDLEIEIPAELFSIREYTCTCTEILDLTYDIKQFRLELVEPETMDYIPGQYVQLLAPVYEKSSEEVYRAYSISSDPSNRSVIELIIRLMPNGICTTYCFDYLKVGDEVKINGPYGDFRLTETDRPIVFIAGGSGMAPIKCILHHMKNSNNSRKAVYYFGANKINDLFLTDLMRDFESTLPDFRFVPAVAAPSETENWTGEAGLVTEVVQRDVKNAPDCEAYLCGSPGMIDASIKVLKELGMNDDRIFFDKFE